MRYLYCASFNAPVACCTSCHDDHAEGHDMLAVLDPSNKEFCEVCCTVSGWLDEHPEALASALADLRGEENKQAPSKPGCVHDMNWYYDKQQWECVRCGAVMTMQAAMLAQAARLWEKKP